jgi:hypothetical protein
MHDCAGWPHTPRLPKHGPLSQAGEGEGRKQCSADHPLVPSSVEEGKREARGGATAPHDWINDDR